MRFNQLDRIVELCEQERIVAIKSLSLAEEYLQAHFPRFPVMPGVLMLEAVLQASAWLIRKSEDFEHAVVLLKEARNVKFSGFVEPGQQLTISAKIMKQDSTLTTLQATGVVGESPTVSARLVLERFNLADRHPERSQSDAGIRGQMRREVDLLYSSTAG